ncbi:hypothetical protein [Escherichia coli]|uniref:hypothetical protein n=1 Tax=Escherichia coli TaxID=562 RepID=UPI002DB6E0E5
MEQENTFSSNIRFFHEPQRLIRINHMIELLAVSRALLQIVGGDKLIIPFC